MILPRALRGWAKESIWDYGGELSPFDPKARIHKVLLGEKRTAIICKDARFNGTLEPWAKRILYKTRTYNERSGDDLVILGWSNGSKMRRKVEFDGGEVTIWRGDVKEPIRLTFKEVQSSAYMGNVGKLIDLLLPDEAAAA